MNILYFTYTMPKPRATSKGPFTYNRIKELVKNDINLTVVTTSNVLHGLGCWGKNYNFKDIGLGLDLAVINLPKIEYPYRYIDLLRQRNLSRLIHIFSHNKCDILHAHFVRDGLYAYWLKKKYHIHYITTVHGYDITIAPHFNSKIRQITVDVLENADSVIFVSSSLLSKAKELGYSGKNSVVIPNGYDPDLFKLRPGKSPINNEKIIGFCGGLHKRKRADKLPIILNYLSKMDKKVRLLIVGDGHLKNQMLRNFKRFHIDDRVKFTGHLKQRDVAEQMQRMESLSILPSQHEGYPRSFLKPRLVG